MPRFSRQDVGLLTCVLGIYFFYISYGILQEKLYEFLKRYSQRFLF